jgi:4-amino-4-deoxy-L-arabinose transferase-like glycosyltransferase
MALTAHRCQYLFWLFALIHVLFWTVVPSLARHELDSDSMMHFAWGQEWMGSYRLHPPFLPWVVAGFLKTVGINNWSYNLLTQLNFLAAFYCIWRLAREYLPPASALAAVCLLEFLPYFSFLGMRLNHSSMLIPMWALTTLLAYFAIQRGHTRYWIALGLAAALAMLTKYYSAAMLPAIAFYLLIFPQGRASLKTPGPYLSLAVFCALLGWHLWYVFTHQVGTVTHIGDYLAPTDLKIRWRSIRFLLAQLLYLCPLVAVFLFIRYRTGRGGPDAADTGDQQLPGGEMRSFIYWMFLFPLLGTTVVGFTAGIDISSRWGGPTLSLAGIVLLLQWPAGNHVMASRQMIRAAFIWALVLPTTLLVTGLASTHHQMHRFPGKELGRVITQLWHEAYQTPLRIVGGGHDAPDSIAFHSPDHPSVLQHMSQQWSPWITSQEISEQGIAVICLEDDPLCITNAGALFPDRAMKTLTVTAEPTLFFPGSKRKVRYLFVGPGEEKLKLDTIQPMPMRQEELKE